MNDVSPELALVIEAAKLRSDAAAGERAATLAGRVADWWRVIRIAETERVVPSLARAVAALEPSAVPAPARAHIETRAGRMRERSSRLASEAARLCGVFAGAGIPLLIFKGPVADQGGYPIAGVRDFTDLDLLVRPSDIPRACALLGSEAYDLIAPEGIRERMAYEATSASFTFIHREHGAELDVHWHILPPVWRVPLDLDGLWRRARSFDLAEGTIMTFAPEDEAMMLALHGTKERWIRLRMACDMAHFVLAHPTIDWDLVLERARAQHCLRAVLLGMAIVESRLGGALPDAVHRAIGRDSAITRLEHRAWAMHATEQERDAALWRPSALRLLSLDRWTDRFQYVFRVVCMPRPHHVGLVRWPFEAYWSFVPVKLAHDYFALPIHHGLQRLRHLG